MSFVQIVLICNLLLLALFFLVLGLFWFFEWLTASRVVYNITLFILPIVFYAASIFLIYLFYRFGQNQFNLYALPVSFLVFPVFLFVLLKVARLFADIKSGSDSWEIMAVLIAFYHSWPLMIISAIVSRMLTR